MRRQNEALDSGRATGDRVRRRYLLTYLLVALPISLLFNWRTDLISMEGIIALAARHMRASGDWIVPRLYGDIYAFKPAMVYWMAAGTEWLFGRQTEFSLRLPTALCGVLLGLALFFVMGALVTPRCGLFCALAATTSGIYVEQIGMAGFDVPLTLGSTLAVLAACRNLSVERADWRYWVLGYAGLWFAFMSKGIPALVVYAPGLIVAGLAVRRFGRLFQWSHLLGVTLFLAATGLYLYLAYLTAQADAFKQHLGELILRSARFGGAALLQMALKPFIIVGVFMPWSAAVIYAAVRQRKAYSDVATARTWRIAWAFLITGLSAYLLVTTDDTRYYLPLAGPIAMVAGMALERLPAPHARAIAVIFTVIGCCVLAINDGIVQPRRARKRSLRSVAAVFAPHIPRDAPVYVDALDNYSSLFFYLEREGRHWRSRSDRRDPEGFIVLIGDQHTTLLPPPGSVFQTVVSVIGPDKRPYTLARVTRAAS
ncbi:MAG TPA: glycosyltransferase family 39 protein [Phycisphaerae bacterium]